MDTNTETECTSETMDIVDAGIQPMDMMDEKPLTRGDGSVAIESANYPMTKTQVIKNMATLCVSFLLLFTAFQSLQNLQSSVNREEGLGTAGLSVVYSSGIVAGLLLPPVVIDRLGCKWTIVASIVCYVVYMAANLHPTWGTIIPAAVIIGVGAAPLWAAKCTYLTQTAVGYAGMTQTTKDDIINRFFGVFFMAFQTSQIWGNLISSLVFSHEDNTTVSAADTVAMETCGATFCPAASHGNNTNLHRPGTTKIYTVCGIYLGCAVLGAVTVAVVLDPIKLDRDRGRPASRAEKKGLSLHLMTKISRHFWKSRYQKLLIPLTVYSGMEQAFIAADFTQPCTATCSQTRPSRRSPVTAYASRRDSSWRSATAASSVRP